MYIEICTYTDIATRTQNATLNAAGIDSVANYYCFSVVEAQWKRGVESGVGQGVWGVASREDTLTE